MHRLFSVLLAAVLLVVAGQARADDLTSGIRNHYKTMTSFTASFSQTLTHRESGSVERRQGTISFMKPLRLRFETKSPRRELLLVTKQVIWNYIPDEEVAYQYNPALVEGAASIIGVITGQSDLMREFDVKRVGLENGLQRLKLYPKTPTTQLVEADIWVDPTTGVIRKTESVDFYGNGNALVFDNYTENVRLKEGLFAFTPPKGVEVEDRRKDTGGRDLLR